MLDRLFRRRGGSGRGSRGGQGQGAGRAGQEGGSGDKPGSGPGGSCVCPKCGHRIAHQVGQRCLDLACPQCGTKMARE